MAKKRRTFSAEQKVPILRRHLVDKVAVSDLYDEYGLNARCSTAGRRSPLKTAQQPLSAAQMDTCH